MATKKKKKVQRKAAASRTKARTKPAARRKAAAKPRASGPAKDRRSSPKQNLRLRAASPSLTVDDLQESLAFYEGVLGFHVKDRWMNEGKLQGVELVAGAVSFFIGQDDWKKGRERVKGEGFRIHCTTAQDVDAYADQIKARGGRLVEEPKSQAWGTRDFAVQDPDGFKITFSSAMK